MATVVLYHRHHVSDSVLLFVVGNVEVSTLRHNVSDSVVLFVVGHVGVSTSTTTTTTTTSNKVPRPVLELKKRVKEYIFNNLGSVEEDNVNCQAQGI